MVPSAKPLEKRPHRHSMSDVELDDLDRGALLVFLLFLHFVLE